MGRSRNIVYLGLGSNIDPDCHLPEAVECLRKFFNVVAVSSAWQTPAVGSSGPDYLNAVIAVETELSPSDIKQAVLSQIEDLLGRVRTEDKYADRTIDIDILLIRTHTLDCEIWSQPHIAIPMSELYPDLASPNSSETLAEVAEEMLNSTHIQRRPDIIL